MEVLDKYDHVEIRSVEGDATPLYKVLSPKLTKVEQEQIDNYKKIVPPTELRLMRGEVDISLRWELLKKTIVKKIKDTPNKSYVAKKILGLALGYGDISPLIDDDNLEEIMINGINIPVFVYHRRHGMCRTNMVFSTTDAIDKLIHGICYINNREPETIIDIASIDGNRINITADPLPSKGSTITIRKQRRKVYSIVELMEQNTISPDLAAFLWLAVEGMKLTPANLLIAGSIGSGKTTTLNALCTFIPPNERIITIEDTFELNIDNIENKVQLETRDNYDMDALLRDTLRMRPDRVLVGEIRGKEAITLFNAMNIGRIGMGTLHSSSARDVAARLENEPMNVPAKVVGSLDLIVVQNKFVHNGRVIRRITEVAEVSGTIKDTVMMGQIYEWDAETDRVIRKKEQELKNPILFLDKLSEATKLSKSTIIKELELREAVLTYLLRKGIKDQIAVEKFIYRFYTDLQGLIRETPDLFGEAIKPKEKK